MANFTIKDLREAVNHCNDMQAASLSNHFFQVGERYGYKYVDLYRFEEDGSKTCVTSALGSGTSKQAFLEASGRASGYREYIHPQTRLSRAQAYKRLSLAGIDFNADFHVSPLSCRPMLVDWAKATGYRKPSSAKHSTAYYFFQHLARKYSD